MHPEIALFALWALWLISWVIAAPWANRTTKRPAAGVEVGYRLLQLVGALLLFGPWGRGATLRLWRLSALGAWLCVLPVAIGMAFAWWARLHLGRLWSGHITRKAGHRVVDSGPYALVRHPIYSGLLLGMGATAAVKATPAAIGGFLLLTLGFWIKARLEEDWLSQELDPGAYAVYRRRVPMLVPFPIKSRADHEPQ